MTERHQRGGALSDGFLGCGEAHFYNDSTEIFPLLVGVIEAFIGANALFLCSCLFPFSKIQRISQCGLH